MKRREFLKVSCVAIAGATIAACKGKKAIPTLTPLPIKPGEVKYTFLLSPGSPEETNLLVDENTSAVVDSARTAEVGKGWIYRLPISTSVSGALSFECNNALTIQITNTEDALLQSKEEVSGNYHQISFAVLADHPAGGEIQIKFEATNGAIAVKNTRLTLQLPDTNGDGIADTLARLMGAAVDEPLDVTPLPAQPHTSFFYAGDYDPRLASPTDIVRLYTYSSTWADKGYSTQVMVHSRFRPPGEQSLEEVQTDAEGNLWGVAYARRDGKLIDVAAGALSTRLKLQWIDRYGVDVTISMDEDYYKVPTLARNDIVKDYYVDQLEAGANGVGYDEPEFWAATGYSEAFKREWQSYYGTPWEPPGNSVDSRYKSEPLKSWLFVRQVKAILKDVMQRKPEATRLISLHSPINYYEIGIVAAHSQLVLLPEVQEIIAEVWSGTAKSPEPLEGKRAARTFEVALLEYSSFWNLVRGLGKRLWFLQDPMEDMPNLSLQEYITNYSQTVVAALMFPQVDCYEVLVWPNRIYGTVPGTYETVINTITGMFSELWRYPTSQLEAGSEGIGILVADSMGWQRGNPIRSDYDGFYGITLPLVTRGIPLQVLSFDRVLETDYLKDIKTLLVTYDYLKPASSELNTALAEWCKAGGTLIFVGGTDTYNRVKESWWKKAGYGSPGKHLLEQLGFQVGDPNVHEYTDIILHRDDPAKKLGKSPETVTISRAYPVTIYTPPAGATILYHVVFDKKNDTTHQPAIWQTSVGKGNLIVIGIAPGFFSTLPDAVQILVSLVSTGYKKAGEKYKEKGYFKVERGPYVAVHGFDEDNKLHGQYISLFDPNLELKTDPTVYPGETALYAKVDLQGKTPRLLHASGRIYARFETASNTSFFVKAPLKSRGVARLWAGKHKIQEVKAYNVLGRPVYNRYEIKNQTIYVQYENDPDGVVVMVTWKS